MRNPENEICFAQTGTFEKIASFSVTASGMAAVMLEDGSEEMFTTEIHPNIHRLLAKQTAILVAHIADDGKVVVEYTVPVTMV